MSPKSPLLALAFVVFCCAGLPGQPLYTMVDLGTVPGGSGSGTTPIEMNAMGDCVGWSTVGSAPHAFLYTDEQGLADLGNLSGSVSALARAVNDSREAVGESTWTEWRWTPSAGMAPYAPSYWTRPVAINNAGMIVGTLNPGTFSPSPFLYTPSGGVVQFAGAVWGNAYDVNESGTVVGNWGGTGGSTYNAATGSQPLPTLVGYPWNAPVVINDLGQVAGNASPVTGLSTWFRFTPGIGIVNIGVPGAWGGGVYDMNNSGDIVGSHNTNPDRAFLYTDAAGFQDLNSLVTLGSGYTLRYAAAINDAGQILCGAYNTSLTPSYRAVRLDPIAPRAWVKPVGTGCGPTPTRPVLTGVPPVLGGTLSVTASHAAPATAGFLVATLGRPSSVSLGAGCTLYVDLAKLLLPLPIVTDSGGNAAFAALLPMDPALAGYTMTWQVGLVGGDMSNGLLMQLGN